MKNRYSKAFATTASAVLLCASLSLPAIAAPSSYAAVEARNRQAVAVAVAEGIVPTGTSIYDCMYQTGEDGVMHVVGYRDAGGNWIDLNTTGAAASQAPAVSSDMLTVEELEDYADEVFRLINEAREEAGLTPLERDEGLDESALIRAEECAYVGGLRVDGAAHTRPDGSPFYTVGGLEDCDYYGENLGKSGGGPEGIMRGWLGSDGHRGNILSEKYPFTRIGIAVFQAEDGDRYWCQLFSKP